MTPRLLRRRLPAFRSDTTGATSVEYALLVSLIALVAFSAARQVGDSVEQALRLDIPGLGTGSGPGVTGDASGSGSSDAGYEDGDDNEEDD